MTYWEHPAPEVEPGETFVSEDGQRFGSLEELYDYENKETHD